MDWFWLRLRCPDCEIQVEANGGDFVCPRCSRVLRRCDGILYALPAEIENEATKEREKAAWKQLYPTDLSSVRDEYLRMPFVADKTSGSAHFREASRQFKLIAEYLQPLARKRGLDLGGSIGWGAYRFSQMGARMVLADFNDSANSGLGAAGIYLDTGVEFDRVCVDAERLPFDDEQFDFVYSCALLHHLTQPRRAIAHIGRVLKPGGVYLAAIEGFCPFWKSPETALMRCGEAVENRARGINEQVFQQREYEAWFAAAGLRLEFINPRWDEASGGQVKWGSRLTDPNYAPEILENRVGAGGLKGLAARAALRWRLWRPLADPWVFKRLRRLLLASSQKFRIMVGTKPDGAA